MSCFSGPEIVNDGLVLHLDAANPKSYPGSGTVWSDLSGGGMNATLVGAPGIGNFHSLSLNGTSQYATVPSSTLWNFGTGDFTFEMWFNITTYVSTNNAPTLFGVLPYYSASPSGLLLCVSDQGQIGIYTNNYYTSSSMVIPMNSWLQCVLVRAMGVTRVYVQCVEVLATTGLSNFNIVNQTGIAIGRDTQYSSDFFTGSISSFKVYSRGVDLAEIQQNFNALRGRYGI